jgi:hypothetical protein
VDQVYHPRRRGLILCGALQRNSPSSRKSGGRFTLVLLRWQHMRRSCGAQPRLPNSYQGSFWKKKAKMKPLSQTAVCPLPFSCNSWGVFTINFWYIYYILILSIFRLLLPTDKFMSLYSKIVGNQGSPNFIFYYYYISIFESCFSKHANHVYFIFQCNSCPFS